MNRSQHQVLADLKRKTRRGISAQDYPKGFRLGARIHDLRSKGIKIVGRRDSGRPLHRYFLVSSRAEG